MLTLFASAEPSKVPFYIAGAALAIWAVALAGLGLTRPSFPYSSRGQRGVILLSALIAVLAIAMSIVSSK